MRSMRSACAGVNWQVKPLGQKLMGAAGTAAGYAAGGVGGAVLGREAMQAVEKTITSTAWNTVSAGMKSRLADAIAGGDTSTILNATKAIAKGTAMETATQVASPAQARKHGDRDRREAIGGNSCRTDALSLGPDVLSLGPHAIKPLPAPLSL